MLYTHTITTLYLLKFRMSGTTTYTTERLGEIYKSRNTLIEIMRHRGFDTETQQGFTYSEVAIMALNNQLDMIFTKPLELESSENTEISDSKKVYVKYNVSSTIRRPIVMTDMVEDMFTIDEVLTKNDDLMIITIEDTNDTITRLIEKLWCNDSIYVSIVNISRIQFNILNHRLVPKHTVLSDSDKLTVMTRYNIRNISQMPVISRFDPVANVLGVRPGEIVHIERPSKTAITSDYYRACI